MSLTRKTLSNAAIGIGVSQDYEGLKVIHKPGCAAAIWQRTPLPEFQHWIDNVDPAHLPKTRMIVAPDKVRDALQKTALMCGTPNCPECGMLVDDISALTMIFADVMKADYIRLRLDAINTNACAKFHIDAVTARMVCTYRGTGTQYGISPDGTEPSRIFTVPSCAPIILRGMAWPEGPKSGLLHRSPPIEGTHETRLLLVLDPVTDPGAERDHTKTTIH
ncbi:MAG: DUF1826 domain-containing protein [Pseudomonadota bacterium]